jgi:anti-anti-sigma factor
MSTYCTYAPTGRIDASNAGACEKDLLALMEASGPSAIIDLSGLSYISSAGLRVLLVGAKAARGKGG